MKDRSDKEIIKVLMYFLCTQKLQIGILVDDSIFEKVKDWDFRSMYDEVFFAHRLVLYSPEEENLEGDR